MKSLENRFGIDHNNTDSMRLLKAQENGNQQQVPPPPPPRVPPPNLSNYLKENDLPKNAVYNSPWNLNILSPSNNSRYSENTQSIQNYMIIDENSQNLLLNQLYQQQLNNEQTNQLYKIISLSNEITQNMIKTNSLKINEFSNYVNQNGISNLPENNIELDSSIMNSKSNVNSWENTVIPPQSSNLVNKSNNNSTVSSSSNFSNSNYENEDENEYATYLSTKLDADTNMQTYDCEPKIFSYNNRAKLNIIESQTANMV